MALLVSKDSQPPRLHRPLLINCGMAKSYLWRSTNPCWERTSTLTTYLWNCVLAENELWRLTNPHKPMLGMHHWPVTNRLSQPAMQNACM